jgi:hypothetical protein
MIHTTAFAAVDYGAELVDVEGNVWVTLKTGNETLDATVGLKLVAGDAIETGEDGAAEILFDDGNVTRMDENSKMTIETLSVDDDRNQRSVLGLAYGRVKNSVAKLVSKRSKFEVHTKSAVAGVTGTPEWVVGAFEGEKHTTEVDLLGEEGEEGSIFVMGTDPERSVVILVPRTRTIAVIGTAPVEPFPIEPDRFDMLSTLMPIKTSVETMEIKWKQFLLRMEGEEEKAAAMMMEHLTKKLETKDDSGALRTEPEDELPETEPKKEITDTNLMTEHLTRQVSVGSVIKPGDSKTGIETECQNNRGCGTRENPVPHTTAITLRFNITY